MTRNSLSLVIAALLLQAPPARAAQLDKDSCSKLKAEQVQLEQGGARGSLSRGPEWAKSNLAPEKLELVRRLIEVDEQLLFRCGGRPLVILPSDPDPAARETQGRDGAKGPPAAAPKAPAGPKKAGEKKAVPQKKTAAPVEPQALGLAKEAPSPQPDVAPVTPPPPAASEAAKVVPTSNQVTPQPEAAPAAPAPPPAAAETAKLAPASNPTPQPQAAPVTPTPPATKEATKQVPPAMPASEPAAAPAAPSPLSTKEAEDKKAAAIKAAKAKAKKKAADAYRPPPPDWASNPFADQAAAPAKK